MWLPNRGYNSSVKIEDLKNKKIHFLGIGGIGMSGLARILLDRGYDVSGSDMAENGIIEELRRKGAKIQIGHDPKNIDGVDVMVKTAAIREDNLEYLAAKEKSLLIIKRSELLGMLMSEKKGIAVAGTHGKTTTSSMLFLILEKAGLDPTVVIGGEVKNIGGNAKDGKGKYFVAEACEYEKGLLDLYPYAAIITNIEEDHLDTFNGIEDILDTFSRFVGQISGKGFLVISADSANTVQAAKKFKGDLITYGIDSGKLDFSVKDIHAKNGKTEFTVFAGDKRLGAFNLIIPGVHNISNALAAIAVATKLGIELDIIKKALSEFRGAKRRFEIKGNKKNILVIDDYAHHPTEIKATLSGLRSYYPKKRVWAIFQPHQYSRTKFLLSDFAGSFSEVDEVIIPDIYAVRDSEEDKKNVNSQVLVDEVNKVSKNATYIAGFKEIADYLKKNTRPGDIIITIGAGPVYQVGEAFLK